MGYRLAGWPANMARMAGWRAREWVYDRIGRAPGAETLGEIG